MKELVSIVVAAYNAEKYISETINSVLSQTYKHWELIIVDDCSTDKTHEIIKNFQKKHDNVYCYTLEKNSGSAAKPRNTGIQKSKGQFIAILDADDLWQPEKLAKQIRYLKNTNADLVYTSFSYIYENGKEVFYKSRQISNLTSLLIQNSILLSSVLMKNTPDITFTENHKIRIGEDYFLWLCLKNKGYKFALLKENLTSYRYLENSMLHRSPSLSLFESYIAVITFFKEEKKAAYMIPFVIVAQTFVKTVSYFYNRLLSKI